MRFLAHDRRLVRASRGRLFLSPELRLRSLPGAFVIVAPLRIATIAIGIQRQPQADQESDHGQTSKDPSPEGLDRLPRRRERDHSDRHSQSARSIASGAAMDNASNCQP